MNRHLNRQDLPWAQRAAERLFRILERLLHIDAVGGGILLIAALLALLWANSPFRESYHALWHLPLSVGLGPWQFSQSLHFWINDVLMTIFFLVVGMEIRREIHSGSLQSPRQALLPLAAAAGGVLVPALIFLALIQQESHQEGWAIPIATDIAFAVGLLALLGRSIPGNLRIFLLALAVIDDIIAILVIAFFYAGELNYIGFAIAAVGMLMIVGLHQIGIGSAWFYVVPGTVLWSGLLMTGAHPTLAGVVLGLMTPVRPMRLREHPLNILTRNVHALLENKDPHHSNELLRQIRLAQREFHPPVTRIQEILHPWVTCGIMPLFALANAGIPLDDIDLAGGDTLWLMLAIALALALGKPLGVVGFSWILVRLGWCHLPQGVSLKGILLVGLLAGVGFTMSIFIAMLAFEDEALLATAKLGVLTGSLIAGIAGLAGGYWYVRHLATTREH